MVINVLKGNRITGINDREISRCQMRFPYYFFVVVFLVPLVCMSAIVSAESGPVPSDTNGSIQDISALLSNEPAGVVVYFFYNQNCGECQKALTFMGEFHKRHPEIMIRSFNIADSISNQHLFRQFNQRYNIPVSSVPVVFVGELGLTDFENIDYTSTISSFKSYIIRIQQHLCHQRVFRLSRYLIFPAQTI